MTPEKPVWTFREAVGGLIATMIVGAICFSALYLGSEASGTALVGGLGAVTAWLFRGASGQPPSGNGNGYPSGSAGSGGGEAAPKA